MTGQMTIFDFIKQSDTSDGFSFRDVVKNDIRRRGSLFEGGKRRIMLKYIERPAKEERIAFLKKEFGIGGHSHDFPNGKSGMIDHDAKGIRASIWDGERQLFPWSEVDTMICEIAEEDMWE